MIRRGAEFCGRNLAVTVGVECGHHRQRPTEATRSARPSRAAWEATGPSGKTTLSPWKTTRATRRSTRRSAPCTGRRTSLWLTAGGGREGQERRHHQSRGLEPAAERGGRRGPGISQHGVKNSWEERGDRRPLSVERPSGVKVSLRPGADGERPQRRSPLKTFQGRADEADGMDADDLDSRSGKPAGDPCGGGVAIGLCGGATT